MSTLLYVCVAYTEQSIGQGRVTAESLFMIIIFHVAGVLPALVRCRPTIAHLFIQMQMLKCIPAQLGPSTRAHY